MKVCINQILERYPNAQIGFLVARVTVKKSDPFVESLKQRLTAHLRTQGIHETNFTIHPAVALWRKIYEEDFQVKSKTYRSSVESLLRRVVTGKELWNICNVVDLYNCCSIFSLLPMGGYDLKKVSGDIEIRFGKTGETFLGLGERQKIDVEPHHIVYADDKRILCWLWNHKDSGETCIDEGTESVIFFIDSFDFDQVQNALRQLEENLKNINSSSLESGVLNHASPERDLKKWC